MGVSVREKKKGSGIYWIFIRHKGIRKSQLVGPKDKAEKIADIIRGELAKDKLGILEKKQGEVSALKFRVIANQWLELVVKSECRETTYNRYRSMLRMYVNPVFGKHPINEIARSQVKKLLRSMVRKGLSRSSVETAKNCISGVSEFAIDEEILAVDSNPARGAMKNVGVAKKSDRKPISIFTADEVCLILNTVKKIRPDYYHLFLCAFRTGMRLGEILALKWEKVNWKDGYIIVDSSWRNSVLTDTKTGKSRHVDMSNQLALELQELLLQRKNEAIRKGSSEPVSIIFHDRKGYYLSQNSVRNIWRRVLKKAGIDYRKFHSARHTFASLMLASGIPVSYVKEMMGHSSIQMTVDIYGHLLPDRDKSAVNILDQIGTPMAPAKKETPVTNEDYEGFCSLVAMQGLEPRTLRI